MGGKEQEEGKSSCDRADRNTILCSFSWEGYGEGVNYELGASDGGSLAGLKYLLNRSCAASASAAAVASLFHTARAAKTVRNLSCHANDWRNTWA